MYRFYAQPFPPLPVRYPDQSCLAMKLIVGLRFFICCCCCFLLLLFFCVFCFVLFFCFLLLFFFFFFVAYRYILCILKAIYSDRENYSTKKEICFRHMHVFLYTVYIYAISLPLSSICRLCFMIVALYCGIALASPQVSEHMYLSSDLSLISIIWTR